MKRKNSQTVTYGVHGLMEWIAVIPVAGRSVQIHFSGGTATGFGIAPATYTTADPVMQRIIESSHLFRSRRIVKIK